MKARIRVAKHALHPMLVVFPLGLLATSVAWDICRLATGNPSWGVVAFWTIVAGVIGGLVAAVPGFFDWLAIPDGTRAKTVGTTHMILNLVVVGLFVVSLIARSQGSGGYAHVGFVHMVWGWIGVGIALASAWLGGELVETLGISVHEGANANAPSSLQEDRGPGRGGGIRVHREA
jgi:uncharacterized membrane protein